jgi:uncharacterized protein with von Willebrand factor type A (vWA) domain
MIVEKGFPRRNRNVGCREPNPRARVRLSKETLANIGTIAALTLMSGAVKATGNKDNRSIGRRSVRRVR